MEYCGPSVVFPKICLIWLILPKWLSNWFSMIYLVWFNLILLEIHSNTGRNCNCHRSLAYPGENNCPYHCSYCLASLEERVRYFEPEQVKDNILYLINKGARVFKFLDRTFNLNIKNSIEIIEFIIENHKPGNSFQFEITGDISSEMEIFRHIWRYLVY